MVNKSNITDIQPWFGSISAASTFQDVPIVILLDRNRPCLLHESHHHLSEGFQITWHPGRLWEEQQCQLCLSLPISVFCEIILPPPRIRLMYYPH